MINPYGNRWEPEEGFKYISNGEIWTDGINLGKRDSIGNWHDTNSEPPMPEDEPTADEVLDILLGVTK